MTTSTRCTYWSMRASDFLSISIHTEPNYPTSFTTQRGTPVSLIETLGRVVRLQRTPLTLTIRIYDGSCQIPCIQTLEPAHGTYVSPDIARRQAEPVELGKLVRVLGKLDLDLSQIPSSPNHLTLNLPAPHKNFPSSAVNLIFTKMNWFQAIHVKLLASDFLSLTVHNSPNYAPTFFKRGMQVWRLETVGVVVSKERTGDFLKFVVDDGTGCIPCIIDLTDRSHLGLAAEVETERALREVATVELGKLVRVRGMITLGEEDGLQLKVRDVVVERDPNMEPLHWMDCIRLARSCYDRAAHP
ncbi:hypothetical protein ZIOFF_075061 [Zingiber officinale]|uniref:CST complex subunit STN1 n=2 Tax=Zingiber officinale TaxID=94328 RepID=A0A8J5C597_ZINOF|nr:hypothetical protein ZIOFF_075061 [Zingiber officinale]